MFSISNLDILSATKLWNKTLFSRSQLVPYSFNPSLFHFFTKHFHWRPYYFFIYDDKDDLTALFPLIHTGKAWVSLPHFSYGGVLETGKLPVNKGLLIGNLISQTKEKEMTPGFYKVMINGKVNSPPKNEKYFIRSLGNQNDKSFLQSEKATLILHLKEKEPLFASLSSNLRRKIRKAGKSGFHINIGQAEILHDFYLVYTQNIRRLKSIPYDKRFFSDLLESWQFGMIRFFVVYLNTQPVAAALLASYRGFYENLYFASLPDARRDYVSDWLHWQMIQFAVSEEKQRHGKVAHASYSFGRSTESSSVYDYKKHWPVEVIPLFVASNGEAWHNKAWINRLRKMLPSDVNSFIGKKLIKHIY